MEPSKVIATNVSGSVALTAKQSALLMSIASVSSAVAIPIDYANAN
jgi:hypothetical protein